MHAAMMWGLLFLSDQFIARKLALHAQTTESATAPPPPFVRAPDCRRPSSARCFGEYLSYVVD